MKLNLMDKMYFSNNFLILNLNFFFYLKENEVIDESRVKEIVEAAEEISEAITNAAISLVVKETSLENINKSSQDNDETEEDMK